MSSTNPYVYYPETYGAKGDGVTNDVTAIQAAINAAGAAGGGTVFFAAKTYAVGSRLTVTNHHVSLIGAGSDVEHSYTYGAPCAATTLLFNGSSGGQILQIYPSSGTYQLTGVQVQGIAFLSNNGLAANGLEIQSCINGYFTDLYFDNFTSSALLIHTVASTSSVSPRNTNFCVFQSIQCTNSSNSGHCFMLDGDAANSPYPDTSQNTFINCAASSYNGNALNINYADANVFYNCNFGSQGTGLGIRFGGNTTGPSFNNSFYGLVAGAHASITVETGSKWNSIFGFTYAETPPTPTIQTGAALFIAGMGPQTSGTKPAVGMYFEGLMGIKMLAADSLTGADNAYSSISTESLRIKNSSANHMVLDDGTHTAGISLDSSGNLILSPNSSGAAISIGSSGYPTINSGFGVPTSTQPKGSIYCRTNGGVGSTLYVSQGGGTWNAVAGV